MQVQVICLIKSKDSYNRISYSIDDIEMEEHITSLEHLQEKIATSNYDVAIVDEKLWWKDQAIQLLKKSETRIVSFNGNFETTVNEVNASLEEIKKEVEEENKDVKKDEPEIKYVYLEKIVKVPVPAPREEKEEGKEETGEKNIKEVEKVVEKVVEVERIVNVYELPEDYRKVIGVIGIDNVGKTQLCLYCAKVISSSKKVAIIDFTENKNLKFYFENEEENESYEDVHDNYKTINIDKNICLYTLENRESLFDVLDEIENKYDALIIDIGSSISKELGRYIDKLYIVTDGDIVHSEEVNNYFKEMDKLKISYSKCRLIYNKVLINKYIKTLKDISKYDFNKDEDYNINKTCDEDIMSFNVKFVTDEKIYDRIINFDVQAYKEDEIFRSQIEAIANDMYPVSSVKKGIGGKIKGLFNRWR